MTMRTDSEPILSRRAAAVAGLASGAAALGGAELLAGLLPGAASPIIAVGDLVIALQPPGAKQFVVDLFGEADKLILNVLIAAVALALAAGVGVLARTRPGTARTLIAAGGLVALGAGLRDPLSEPITSLDRGRGCRGDRHLAARLADAAGCRGWSRPTAEMPDWGRRRFLGTSVAVVGVAAASGLRRPRPSRSRPPERRAGGRRRSRARSRRRRRCRQALSLDVPELTPDRRPEPRLLPHRHRALVPRPDVDTWRLRSPAWSTASSSSPTTSCSPCRCIEQYVTIACVCNEVGGDLVGNALWRGVRLTELLEQAGVQPGGDADRRPLGRRLHRRLPDLAGRSPTSASRWSPSA